MDGTFKHPSKVSTCSHGPSSLVKFAVVTTATFVVIGAGRLYIWSTYKREWYRNRKYLFRLERILRKEARQKRLMRKLLERQGMNMDPVHIYQVQKTLGRYEE
jgi:hypothetical protein